MADVDFKAVGDSLIYMAAVSASGFALWKMWFKDIVQWFHRQGETNTKVAQVITEELPKMTKAIERVSDTQRDHTKQLREHDERIANLEGGGAISGASPRPSGAFMNQPKRRRRASE